MTKGEATYLLRNALVGDTPTQEAGVRFNENQLIAALDVAYEALVRQEYKKYPTSVDLYCHLSSVIPTVAANGDGYATLGSDVRVMNLNGIPGVRTLMSTTNPAVRFTMVDPEMLTALVGSDVGDVGGETFWWMEGPELIRFIRMDPAVTNLYVRYVKRFQGFWINDEVPMPAGRGDLLIEMAKKVALEGIPADQDGSDTSTVKTK